MPRTDAASRLVRRPSRHDLVAFLAFTALIVGTYALGLALGVLTDRGLTVHPVVWEPILFPGLFLLAAPVVAVLNLRTGGTAAGSLAVGLVPGVAFGLLAGAGILLGFGPGDSPLWVLVVYFAGVGFVGALVATALSLVVERLLRSLVSQ